MNNLTVKSRIAIVIVVITFIATAVVAFIRAEQIRTQMDLLLQERLQGNANMTFGIFETVGQYTRWLLDITAGYARQGFTNQNFDVGWQLVNMFDSLNRDATGALFYENIAVFDADFQLVASSVPHGDIPNFLAFPEYLDMQMAGVFVSPVFESSMSGQLQMMFTQPVFYGEDFLGMVAITGNTQRLEFFLRDFIQAYDSFINIADRSNMIFFSNRPEAYTGRHINELGVIEAFGKIPMNTIFYHNSALTGIDKIAYVTYDPWLGWSIVSFFDAHAVEDTTRMILASLQFTVTGILLAAALIVFIIHRALQPLQTLANGANEVSKGNVEVAFNVDKNDEIGRVSTSFMAIVRALSILRSNFKKAEDAMARGEGDFLPEDSRMGGIYDEMLASTSNIVRHIQESQRKAENASKAKSDFLSKMSHEIRTPMNAIIGMTELILRESLTTSAREQAITIRQSGDHLLSIINDILDLSKVESGKLELVKAQYLFHSTIQDVISIIKMRMSNPDVRFAVYMQHDLPTTLYGDEVRVRQVLLNILTNALKYTKVGYFSLNVTGEQNADTVTLSIKIKDTGIGIKAEDIGALYGEFNQFDLEKNRNIEGTGLGLAITKSLVELMGGCIDVSSKYGEGTEFSIALPQTVVNTGDEVPRFANLKVLLYCRTALNLEYIGKSLSDLSVQYEMPANESELGTALASGEWDFVFAEADMTAVTQKIIDTRGLNTKIVMLSDSYDATYEARNGQDFTLLIMPAYFISIGNVLTGRNADYSVCNQNIERFIAPDAKILLVDDIATNLKVGEGLLKLYGIQVDTCLSGREAISAVMTEEYDMVLMDHMMPELDGVETVAIIRHLDEKLKKIPIVALTANAIVGAREMFLANGFDDFLSKPIEVGKLNSILSKWIPKEKQQQGEDVPQTQNEASAELRIDGVDVERGIAFCGRSMSNYLEILAVFLKSGSEIINEIERCASEGNIALYTIHVHAMKSASANIGANLLSAEANALENAGINKDADFIAQNNSAFIANLKKLLTEINGVLTNDAKKENKDFNEIQLEELLINLNAALASFDVSAIDEITEALQPFTAHPKVGKALDDILQKVFIGQYKDAQEAINLFAKDNFCE